VVVGFEIVSKLGSTVVGSSFPSFDVNVGCGDGVDPFLADVDVTRDRWNK